MKSFPLLRRAILAVLATLGSAATLFAAEIELKSQAQPAGAMVLLGDVAEIHNIRTTADRELAKIELIPTPSSSRPRSLRLREVQDLLALQGVKLIEHQFSGASSVQIGEQSVQPATHVVATTGPGTRLHKQTAEQARTRVERAVVKHLQDHAVANALWQVQLELTPAQQELVAARIAEVSVEGGQEPWTGEQQFTLAVRTTQGVSRQTVKAFVALPDKVVVASRPLRRGEVVQASDVELRLPVAELDPAATFTRLEDVVGRETTHSVATGQPVANNGLRNPVMIRRGEVVTVFARAKNILIRTNARAIDEGGRNDVITVERLDDRQRFTARVVGVQECEVFVSSVSVTKK